MKTALTGVAGIIRRHPITAFLVWFFTVGQAFAFAPIYLGTTIPDQWFINASTIIGLLVPALVITRVVDGREGLRELGRRVLKLSASPLVYITGLVVMPLLAIGLAVAVMGAPDAATAMAISTIGSTVIVGTIVGFVLNNLWEEVAWMGFVQARLQQRHGAMRAALIVGPLFTLQHMSLQRGNPAELAVVLLVLTLLLIPFRVFMGWIYNRSGGSLLLVGLIHALGNAAGPGAGFGEGYLRHLYPDGGPLVGVMHVAAIAIIGLIIIVGTRAGLGLPRRPGRSSLRRRTTPSYATAGFEQAAAARPAAEVEGS